MDILRIGFLKSRDLSGFPHRPSSQRARCAVFAVLLTHTPMFWWSLHTPKHTKVGKASMVGLALSETHCWLLTCQHRFFNLALRFRLLKKVSMIHALEAKYPLYEQFSAHVLRTRKCNKVWKANMARRKCDAS